MTAFIEIPAIGSIPAGSGLIPLACTSDECFCTGRDGVRSITATGDRKVEFVAFADTTLAHVNSALGHGAYYPLHPVNIEKPIRAVLMDLDGTSVRSEPFWVWIIQLSMASLMQNQRFELEEADLPFVSGHSVSEHLQYCIGKYCPGKTVEEARGHYFEHTAREMSAILDGTGRSGAFVPAPGLKDFLLELKARAIRIALVTSGLYEKAWPEILSAFQTLNMGDPVDFYDAIISAGFAIRKGQPGTLGELTPKPHPWLYAEACRVGLGIPFGQRNTVVGIEDSGAGICSIRLAGYPAIGYDGGNIAASGTKPLCTCFCKSFEEILGIIR